MPAGGAGHGGRPCSRVSAGPRAVPTTDCDAADEHEHAKDENFVDMLPVNNSPSNVEDYSEDLQLFASPSLQRRRPKDPGICTPGYMGGAQYLPSLASSKHSTATEQNLGVVDLALLSITLYTDITAPCSIT